MNVEIGTEAAQFPEEDFRCSAAVWQWHSAALHATELYTEFWHGLTLVISITSCEVQMQPQLTVACSAAEHCC